MPIVLGKPGDLHVNDIGVNLRCTVRAQDGSLVDLSTTTSRVLNFERPDGTSFDRPATLIDEGANGLMQYITADGDLDQPGYWYLQARVEFESGAELKANRLRVRVLTNNVSPAP